jgi:hypothetical protein
VLSTDQNTEFVDLSDFHRLLLLALGVIGVKLVSHFLHSMESTANVYMIKKLHSRHPITSRATPATIRWPTDENGGWLASIRERLVSKLATIYCSKNYNWETLEWISQELQWPIKSHNLPFHYKSRAVTCTVCSRGDRSIDKIFRQI